MFTKPSLHSSSSDCIKSPRLAVKTTTEQPKTSQSVTCDHVGTDISSSLCDSKVELLVSRLRKAMKETSWVPVLASDGAGGTYFLKDNEGECIAVFKPTDEEPCAINNPKKCVAGQSGAEGSPEEGVASYKRGIRAGEAAVREYVAYLLDHEGAAGVPPTGLVKINCKGKQCFNSGVFSSSSYIKLGSLQEFVEHDYDGCEFGPQRFSVKEVHKIGILDIRLCNSDRHGGNILVREGSNASDGSISCKLVPIDHGFCLPDRLDEAWFEWMTWPQAHVPFDKETKKYIASLDADKDIKLLRKHNLVLSTKNNNKMTEVTLRGEEGDRDSASEFVIRLECLRVMKITTMFLKKCAKYDLTLFQIARMICRMNNLDEPSTLEKIVKEAEEKVTLKLGVEFERGSKQEETAFYKILSKSIDQAAKCPPHIINTRRGSI